MFEKRQQPGRKRLVFHFKGGTHGPHLVRSDQSGESGIAAHKLWAMTMNGVVGRRFDWYEPDGTQRRYQVVDRKEAGDEIIVTCECVSEANRPLPRQTD
jgi:hypothetical protein